MIKKKFRGVVVPMITPVTKEGRMDTAAAGRIMERFFRNGISPLVLGTTGESASVSDSDACELMQAAVEARNRLNEAAGKADHPFRQQVYAGLVGNRVGDLIEQGKRYAEMGVDAVVSTLPSYYILTEAQMKQFYLTLADALTAPLFMYNIKATTQMSIPLETAVELSRHPNIAGLKDSERDEEKLRRSIEAFAPREDFSFFCGWGAQGAASLKLGADGIVPSTGNVVPELYGLLYKAFEAGDAAEADRLQALTDRVAVVYQKGRTLGQSLSALKILMKSEGLCETYMVPPLTVLPEQEAENIVSQFRLLDL